jgi:hypothetical protein
MRTRCRYWTERRGQLYVIGYAPRALEERGATGLAEHTCIQGAGGFGALVLAPVDAVVVVSDLDAAAVGVADKSARDHGVCSTRS